MSEIDRIAEKWFEWSWRKKGSLTYEALYEALIVYAAIVREECAKVCDRAALENKVVQEGFHGELSPSDSTQALVERSVLSGATFQATKLAVAIRRLNDANKG